MSALPCYRYLNEPFALPLTSVRRGEIQELLNGIAANEASNRQRGS